MGRSILLIVLQLLLVTILAFHHDHETGGESANQQRGHGHQIHKVRDWRQFHEQHPHTSHAVCHMMPNGNLPVNETIWGNVYFRRQRNNGVEILLDLHGVRAGPNTLGIHIYEFGDLSRGCDSLGGRFNLHNRWLGSHAGDVGYFRPNAVGIIHETITRTHLHLHGALSIIGRTVLIHKNENDQESGGNSDSAESGNAGLRLACCVIGVSSQSSWPQE